jgi:uncharacterized membrane protein YphA (DoxX/SURF4 family)
MQKIVDSPLKYMVLWLRLVFGVHLLYSGLAYAFAGWTPLDMQNGGNAAGKFLTMLNDVGLFPWVKYLEVVTGAMLICNLAVPLALILEFPLTIVIFFLNLFVSGEGRHIYTGLQELFLNVTLLVAYGGYFASFLRVRSTPWWLWDGLASQKEQRQ